MTGLLVVLCVLLAAGLLGSVVEGVFLADQVKRLHADCAEYRARELRARDDATAARRERDTARDSVPAVPATRPNAGWSGGRTW